MNIEIIRKHCLSKPDVHESFPFDEHTLAFKVGGKIFCLASLDRIPLCINLKCDPTRALELRDQYDTVTPGYHMNKTHWNTITIDGQIPSRNILEWIDHSYELVHAGKGGKRKPR